MGAQAPPWGCLFSAGLQSVTGQSVVPSRGRRPASSPTSNIVAPNLILSLLEEGG